MVFLAEARRRRDEARKLLSDGVDPSAARQQAKVKAVESAALVLTFEVVAHEWMSKQGVAEVTANKNRWLMENYLFPHIGLQPIADTTA